MDRHRECSEVAALLSPWLEGELGEAEAAFVARHLEGCPECRREMEMLRRTVEALRGLPQEVPPPEILRGVREAMSARRSGLLAWLRAPSARTLAQAAAVLVVAASIVLIQYRYPGLWREAPRDTGRVRQEQPAGPPSAPREAPTALPGERVEQPSGVSPQAPVRLAPAPMTAPAAPPAAAPVPAEAPPPPPPTAAPAKPAPRFEEAAARREAAEPSESPVPAEPAASPLSPAEPRAGAAEPFRATAARPEPEPPQEAARDMVREEPAAPSREDVYRPQEVAAPHPAQEPTPEAPPRARSKALSSREILGASEPRPSKGKAETGLVRREAEFAGPRAAARDQGLSEKRAARPVGAQPSLVLYLRAPAGYDYVAAVSGTASRLGGTLSDAGPLAAGARKRLAELSDGKSAASTEGSTLTVRIPADRLGRLEKALLERSPLVLVDRDISPGKAPPEGQAVAVVHIWRER